MFVETEEKWGDDKESGDPLALKQPCKYQPVEYCRKAPPYICQKNEVCGVATRELVASETPQTFSPARTSTNDHSHKPRKHSLYSKPHEIYIN